jgi:hypothetical protein
VCETETCVSLRIVGIDLQCLPEKRCSLFERVAVFFLAKHKLAATKNAVVGGNIGCRGVSKPCLFRRAKSHFERIHDSMRDVVLNLEDIRQVAVVAVSP